ncbi:MAG: hypothetical protein KKH98_00240, partial [Spirochaetes bacterium]|nr:hypothetical protein [Spirochaetota bacterium]
MRVILLLFFTLIQFNLQADITRRSFELKKLNSRYYIPFQNGIIFPDFFKQKSRAYLPVKECRYRRIFLDHKLSVKDRDEDTIQRLQEECKNSHRRSFKDQDWKKGVLPFSINLFPDKYQDGVLYRVKLHIPAQYKNKVLKLFFLGANYITDVWVNEKHCGSHEGGFSAFAFDISGKVRFGDDNIIFVRLDNIPWLMDEYPKGNDHDIVPYKKMDWWNYTGIVRDVYVEISDPLSVVRADVPYEFKKNGDCVIAPALILQNYYNKDQECTVKVNIYEASLTEANLLSSFSSDLLGKKVASLAGKNVHTGDENFMAVEFEHVIPSGNLKYWSNEDPRLYILETILIDKNNSLIEKNAYQFGVRRYEINNQKIYLNNNKAPLFLKGVSYHEEFYPYGRVMEEDKFGLILDNMNLIRDLNANFLRSAHYPHHPFTYLLTDRLGIIVWEEIPVMWFDGPEFLYQIKNKELAPQMLFEMIYANYNSPSILFHGLANECGWQSERLAYLWEMKKLGKEVFPNRIYSQSATGDDQTDNTHRDMDVFGATMYYGVFYWDKPYEHTLYALSKMNSFYPDKPIIATEFGVWSGNEMADLDRQVMIARDTYKAFVESGVVSGVIWWSLVDWYTMIAMNQTMGLVTRNKKMIKPVFLELQRLYCEKAKEYTVSFQDLKPLQKVRGKLNLKVQVRPEKD